MTLKVYRSSAGSGKTFTLALEYLALALRSPNAFRHILGVTFTNKAANEMKARILKFLQVLADEHHPDQKLRALLIERMQESGLGDNTEISKSASKVFHQILHNYSDFSISTIDAFVYRLIRTFSRDVALPTQFELVLESKDIVDKLVERLFDKLGSDEQLTQHLITFLLDSMENDNNHNIEGIIKQFCHELLSERSLRHAAYLAEIDDDTYKRLRQSIRSECKEAIEELLDFTRQALDLLQQSGISPDELAHGSTGIGGQLVKLAENKDFIEFFKKSRVKGVLFESAPFTSKSSKLVIPPSVENKLREIFSKMAEWHRQKYTRTVVLGLILPAFDTLALTARLYRETSGMISEEHIVHISEFNKRVAALLAGSGVPFIYERLGERYRHFLLDEFQDTSVLQWSNFLPLIENGLAGGNTSLIVGDAKQAIYRWRNGEMELFIRLPEIYSAEEMPHLQQFATTLKHHYRLYHLNSNFRSQPAVVDFNNRFFQFVSGRLPEAYQSIYADCSQHFVKTESKGYVSINFIEGDDELNPNEVVLRQLVSILRELFAEGYSPGQVAILCRRNQECGIVAGALTQERIKFVSAESLQLNSSAGVNAIVAAMRALAEGEDKLFGAEILAALAVHRNTPDLITQAFQPAHHLNEVNSHAAEMASSVSSQSLYNLTESITRTLGLHQPYDPFIQAFLDHVLEFQTKEGEGISAFLRLWEEKLKTTTVVLPADSQSVSILTIHKAKGLEFPVVIVPFSDVGSSATHRNKLWFDLEDNFLPPLRSVLLGLSKRKMEDTPFLIPYEIEQNKLFIDTINLAYVAYTRAEERLYIFFPVKGGGDKTISKLAEDFLKQEGVWEQDKKHYTFGQPCKPKTDRVHPAFSGLQPTMMPTGKKPEVARTAKIRDMKAWSFGIRLHRMLSSVRYVSDIEPALEKEAAKGGFTPRETVLVRQLFEQLMAKPSLRPYFEPPAQVFNEAGFADGNGNLFRVDRYVRLGDSHTIIEYKTGAPDETHLAQVRRYMHYVGRMENAEVKGLLVYLSLNPEVVEVQGFN